MPRSDHHWMAEALRLARKGTHTTTPNPTVGCVVVADDRLVASGWHGYAGGPHAEVNALQSGAIPPGATFYVTLEPCSHHGRTPPCVDAVLDARPARVVIAMQDPNPKVGGQGLQKLRDSGVEVVLGVLEAQARELNRGFVKRMEQGLPHVSIKMACSLDGRTALSNGSSQWITAEPARRDVQFLRARACAVLSSAQTVLDDDPALNLRLTKQELKQVFEVRQPVRVLVDSRLRLSGSEKLFGLAGDNWVYTVNEDGVRRERLADRGAEVITVAAGDNGGVDLRSLLEDLARRGINNLHCECGQRLAGALIRQGLADELVLYLAPHLLGSAARGAFDLGEFTDMGQRISCSIRDLRAVGDDLRLTLGLERDK